MLNADKGYLQARIKREYRELIQHSYKNEAK
jgi:hypothetical protein